MFSLTPITTGLVAITCIISFLGFSNRRIIDSLIFWPPAISEKRQYYRFISCGFVHANLIHLAFNMITLYSFGSIMESHFFRVLDLPEYVFLLMYIGALIVSVIPSYIKQKNNYNYRSLGASGAVCAVLFAFVLMRPWQPILVLFIPAPSIVYAALFLIYTAYMSKKGGDHINHDAHFWGALFGIAFMIVVRPTLMQDFLNQLSHPHFNI
ncbi:MAG TPA: rhomboid family intramembrane serine protease [Puia sp.]|nr:rhomboid family intramembrane serine protease [Puia sp.]